MPGPQFFETGYGRKFFGGQLPELIEALSGIAEAAKEANAIARERMETEKKLAEAQEKAAQAAIGLTEAVGELSETLKWIRK